MLSMYTKAKGSEHLDNLVAGAWKFRDARKIKRGIGVTVAELVETAQAMVNAGIGTGRFAHVFVRGTGPDELGICFMYELGQEDIGSDLQERTKDFLMRRHGAACKGWDIGHGIDIVNLTN